MGGRFSAQNKHDAEVNQDRVGRQPQQPHSLCKSICGFFKKNQQLGANPIAELWRPPRRLPIWKLLLMCLLWSYCLVLRCWFQCFGDHWDNNESLVRTDEREELIGVETQARNS